MNEVTQLFAHIYRDLDERMRDALHGYIEERGINESLFPFLQAWLYGRTTGILCIGSNQWAHSLTSVRKLWSSSAMI